MEQVYRITGIIFFWLIALIVVNLIFSLLIELWDKFKTRLWVYQIYETIFLFRDFKRRKKENYINVNWDTIELNKKKIEGKIFGMEHRKNHIFQRKLSAMFSEMLNSEPAKKYFAEKENQWDQ